MATRQVSQKQKTKKKIRARILSSGRPFIKIICTNRYISALILSKEGIVRSEVSTRSLQIQGSRKNTDAAKALSGVVAEKCQSLGLKELAFDRSALKYHGVIKAFAEPLKEAGILL